MSGYDHRECPICKEFCLNKTEYYNHLKSCKRKQQYANQEQMNVKKPHVDTNENMVEVNHSAVDNESVLPINDQKNSMAVKSSPLSWVQGVNDFMFSLLLKMKKRHFNGTDIDMIIKENGKLINMILSNFMDEDDVDVAE